MHVLEKGEAPFPGMSHKSYGNQFNLGSNEILGGDERTPWMQNQQIHPAECNGLVIPGGAPADGLLLNRGTRGGASTASWEVSLLSMKVTTNPHSLLTINQVHLL